MLSKILGLFRGRPAVITGTSKLPDGESKTVSLGDPLAGGTEVVLCRLKGQLHAVDRICPHEGGRIVDGPLVDGEHVVCPLHNYRFDPTSGKAIGVVCPSVKTYKVREDGDKTEIWI